MSLFKSSAPRSDTPNPLDEKKSAIKENILGMIEKETDPSRMQALADAYYKLTLSYAIEEGKAIEKVTFGNSLDVNLGGGISTY